MNYQSTFIRRLVVASAKFVEAKKYYKKFPVFLRGAEGGIWTHVAFLL